jgi:large subunit ribosomal protein L21
MADGEDLKIGKPYLDGAKIPAKIEKQGRAKKIIIQKFKSKTRFRKKQGHRQLYTQIKILNF